MSKKSDAHLFRERLRRLRSEPWLDESRRWWSHFLFHHTDISNIASILSTGRLLSRGQARSQGIQWVDSASTEVIGKTRPQYINYVRFYFRPRTPTLYHVEGCRPRHSQKFGAQCPAPVYLLFDFEGVICRVDSLFSYGTLARKSTQVYSGVADFERMPFSLIYHDSAISVQDRDLVTFHRQAEVVVPDSVDLQYLRRIVCRSQAEQETLRYMLGESLWEKWQSKIIQIPTLPVFFRRWLYVDQASLGNRTIRFRIHQSVLPQDRGPFRVSLNIFEVKTGTPYVWHDDSFTCAQDTWEFSLENLRYPQHYVVVLSIDDNTVYQNEYREKETELDDLPF